MPGIINKSNTGIVRFYTLMSTTLSIPVPRWSHVIFIFCITNVLQSMRITLENASLACFFLLHQRGIFQQKIHNYERKLTWMGENSSKWVLALVCDLVTWSMMSCRKYGYLVASPAACLWIDTLDHQRNEKTAQLHGKKYFLWIFFLSFTKQQTFLWQKKLGEMAYMYNLHCENISLIPDWISDPNSILVTITISQVS